MTLTIALVLTGVIFALIWTTGIIYGAKGRFSDWRVRNSVKVYGWSSFGVAIMFFLVAIWGALIFQ